MVEEKDKKVKELEENIAAVAFTASSKMGKALMAKCKTLQEENDEIGRQNEEGEVLQLLFIVYHVIYAFYVLYLFFLAWSLFFHRFVYFSFQCFFSSPGKLIDNFGSMCKNDSLPMLKVKGGWVQFLACWNC